MKIAVCQINTTVGDFEGNRESILDRMRWAKAQGADVTVFPELAICGYPPRDLLEKPDFVKRNLESVELIAKKTGEMAVVLGFVSKNERKEGKGLFNSAGLLHRGRVAFVQHKTLLPEYDVFDEARHFEPARDYGICEVGGVRVGLSLCEDIWSPFEFSGRHLYRTDPIKKVVGAGAEVVINSSASPFTLGKDAIRKELVCGAARRFARPVVYCNLVGGNDELVFDGLSFAADASGRLVHEAAGFAEDSFIVDTLKMKPIEPPKKLSDEEKVRQALVLALKDYMRKCGFEKVVIGLSGGIDSAVVAAIAAEAIGARKVKGVLMPSPYSSKGSVTDAEALAKNIGIQTSTIPIGDIYSAFRKTLGYKGKQAKVTLAEENMQARIRGTILMAISNRDGALVLSTGNKSEISVGYCTLYGDMAGGLALISDIPKMMVYSLARHLNSGREVIPRAIIEKPPSAELKPDQTDQDSLPPYEILDAIIRAYIEDKLGTEAIVALGYDRKTVERVVGMIDRNEYKRRQAAPGIKVTSKAFGPGRRFPIAWKP
ncbi:MAG: NAD+ synthase [Pseudomonadota bacterium]